MMPNLSSKGELSGGPSLRVTYKMKKMAESRLMDHDVVSQSRGRTLSYSYSILWKTDSQRLAATSRTFDVPEHDNLHDSNDLETCEYATK